MRAMIYRTLALLWLLTVIAFGGITLDSGTTSGTFDRVDEGRTYRLTAAGTWDGATVTFQVWNSTLDDWAPLTTLTSSAASKSYVATGPKFRATISGGSGSESLAIEALRLPAGASLTNAAVAAAIAEDPNQVFTALETGGAVQIEKSAVDGNKWLSLTSGGNEKVGIFTGESPDSGTYFSISNEYNQTSPNTDPRGFLSEEHSDTAHSAHFTGQKSRGSKASPAAVQVGDYLAGFTAKGYDGSTYDRAGYLAWITTALSGGNLSTKAVVSAANTGTENIGLSVFGTGNVVVGDGTTYPTYNLEIRPTTATTSAMAMLDGMGGGATVGIRFRQANGTYSSPTATQSGDYIGFLGGYGYGASAYATSAKALISIKAAENWTNSAQGTEISFDTTASGGTTRTTKMVIKDSGIVNIANAPSYADNTAATSAGLVAGDVYRTATGQLMIVY